MRRERMQPRPDWRATVEGQGLTYAVGRGEAGEQEPYWHEEHAYVLDPAEVDLLEGATAELHRMCVQAAHRMVEDPAVRRALNLSGPAWEYVRADLAAAGGDGTGVPSLYGRFDLAWDGEGPPKLLEYNADTPAGLVEAAVCQWYWLEDVHPDRDQWNQLHERLVLAWGPVGKRLRGDTVHLAVGQDEPDEDWATVEYLAETAQEAGLRTRGITMEAIGWHRGREVFVDDAEAPVEACFKMYPWEWMLAEDFAAQLPTAPTTWLEPPWKLLLGSKALLATLWEIFPDHPNLLPAYLDGPRDLRRHVSKPVFGWEGAGIEISAGGAPVQLQTPGHTTGQARVWQEFVDLPSFDGARPVLGTWVVGGRPAGLGIRESDGLVTDTHARFLPHVIDGPRSTPEQVARWLRDG